MLRFFLIISIIFCHTQNTFAHDRWQKHANDMFVILGFQEHRELKNWMKFVSSDMIDQRNYDDFYNKLKNKHEWFKCKHRLLFHWGYNTEPWNKELEQKTKVYSEKYHLNYDSTKQALQQDLRQEQKRRNRLMNNKTEKLFGFASGGKDASYANFFISMAYNIHLVGDYTSDNADFDGLVSFDVLIGGIVTSIRNLDNNKSKQIIKDLNMVQKRATNEQERADIVLAFLKQRLSQFIQAAENGSVKRRLEKRGFSFIK